LHIKCVCVNVSTARGGRPPHPAATAHAAMRGATATELTGDTGRVRAATAAQTPREHNLAFTRDCFTSSWLRTNQSSFPSSGPPASPTQLHHYYTTIGQYRPAPQPPFCMPYTIQHYEQALVCLSNREIVDASRGCTFHCNMANNRVFL